MTLPWSRVSWKQRGSYLKPGGDRRALPRLALRQALAGPTPVGDSGDHRAEPRTLHDAERGRPHDAPAPFFTFTLRTWLVNPTNAFLPSLRALAALTRSAHRG